MSLNKLRGGKISTSCVSRQIIIIIIYFFNGPKKKSLKKV